MRPQLGPRLPWRAPRQEPAPRGSPPPALCPTRAAKVEPFPSFLLLLLPLLLARAPPGLLPDPTALTDSSPVEFNLGFGHTGQTLFD